MSQKLKRTEVCIETAPTRRRFHLAVLGFASLLALAGCGGGTNGSGPPAGVSVTLSPATVSVAIGDTQQFTATVSGSSNAALTWSVNDTAGGSAAIGTISNAGLYTAPDNLPSPGTVTVKATSQADVTKSASAVVTLTVKVSALDPIVTLQNSPPFVLRIFGRGFTSASGGLVGGTNRATTFVSSTELRVDVLSGDTANAGLLPVAVQEGAAASNPLEFSVVPQPLQSDVIATAGLETTGVDIPVLAISSPTLSLIAVGIGDTAGSVGLSVSRGSAVQLLLVGQGVVPGTYYMIDGASGEFDFLQPVAADFGETTDGIPAVQLEVSVSPSAVPGVRNIMVLNVSGEVAAFVGGILVTN